MNKIIFQPHKKIMEGVNKLADAVQETLGPSGRNVIIYKGENTTPIITKDGVTVARNISLEDQVENIGAALVKEVAANSDVVGDGTTTATVLCRAIYKECLSQVESGINPIELKRAIDNTINTIVKDLESKSKAITNQKDLYQVALISTNNDKDLADLISKAFTKVGKDGFVLVEESQTDNTTLEFTEGYQIDRGTVSHLFFNKYVEKRIIFDNPLILLLNHNADSFLYLTQALEYSLKNNRPLAIFAQEYEDNTLYTLLENKLKAGVRLACFLSPGSGDFKVDYMQDFAKLTGAAILEPDSPPMLKKFDPSFFGTCKKLVADLNKTTITGYNDVTAHIQDLKLSMEDCDKHYYKEKLKDRYAKLTNSIAILKLGTTTKNEMADKKLRVEDAVKATRSALKNGILPGGGIPLLRSAKNQFLAEALEAPIRAILKNSGADVEQVISKIKKHDDFNFGYDARAEEYGNLIDLGIVDSTDVVTTSLRGAGAAASMLLTASCLIVKEDKKNV